MDFDNAIKQIVSKVKELGIGTRLSYEEVNQWLGLSSGDDLMWDYDKLSIFIRKSIIFIPIVQKLTKQHYKVHFLPNKKSGQI